MDAILKDKKLNKEFHEKGFVKFPLFDKKQREEILAFYEEIIQEHNSDKNRSFHTTLNTSNDALIKKVDAFITPYYEQTLKRYLNDFKLTIGGYLAKDTGDDSAVTIHQDWTFVDEERYESFNLWVALEDIGLLDGSMQFIPGSHKFAKTLRISPDIPTFFYDYKEKAADYLMDVPVKAGECVMFYQSMIHASRRNKSKKRRVVTNISAYSKDAELLHFFKAPEDSLAKIGKYRITKQSMLDLKKDQAPPHAELLEYISYEPPKMSFEEFENKCQQNLPFWYKKRNDILNFFLGKSC